MRRPHLFTDLARLHNEPGNPYLHTPQASVIDDLQAVTRATPKISTALSYIRAQLTETGTAAADIDHVSEISVSHWIVAAVCQPPKLPAQISDEELRQNEQFIDTVLTIFSAQEGLRHPSVPYMLGEHTLTSSGLFTPRQARQVKLHDQMAQTYANTCGTIFELTEEITTNNGNPASYTVSNEQLAAS